MTEQLQTKLERIKEQCRKAIDLGNIATAGPWVMHGTSVVLYSPDRGQWEWRQEGEYSTIQTAYDAGFIAHARTFSPASARALLMTIETLEGLYFNGYAAAFAGKAHTPLQALMLIALEWPE